MRSARRALVVGSSGQDGSYLVERLTAEGLAVIGLSRAGISGADLTSAPIDLADGAAIRALVAAVRPFEIYYLAARHFVGARRAFRRDGGCSRRALPFTCRVGWISAIRAEAADARLLYAASAHVFGSDAASTPQNEDTPFRPDSPYAITKAAGLEYCRYYRRRYGVFCAGAILFNHESPRRRPEFVSQRIVRGVAAIRAGMSSELTLGSLSSIVDWGWAPDSVDAISASFGTSGPKTSSSRPASAHRRRFRRGRVRRGGDRGLGTLRSRDARNRERHAPAVDRRRDPAAGTYRLAPVDAIRRDGAGIVGSGVGVGRSEGRKDEDEG
jgi:GDPmannose 4,6-dehydratase